MLHKLTFKNIKYDVINIYYYTKKEISNYTFIVILYIN